MQSTPKENSNGRTYVYEGTTNVIIWQLPIIPSFENMKNLGEQIKKIVREHDLKSWILVTDASYAEAETPSEARGYAREFLFEMTGLKYVGFSTGRRKLTNLVIKYIMGRSTKTAFTINKTFDEALEKALEFKSKHNL